MNLEEMGVLELSYYFIKRIEVGRLALVRDGAHVGDIISSLQHEDSSGLSFNITFESGLKAYLRIVPGGTNKVYYFYKDKEK